MKNLFLTLTALCFINFTSLNATIHHTVFADGWVISLNENVAVDIDNNGSTDFHINAHPNELGFSPEFALGCFAGTSDYTSFGAHELLRYKTGQTVIMGSSANTYFIDDDRGSITGANGELAENWTTGSDQYLGFMIWQTGAHGWMRVSIDLENEQLIIKEWALEDTPDIGITVGDTGATPVSINDLSDEVKTLTLSPNPAVDQLQVSFEYLSDKTMTIEMINSSGATISTEQYIQLPQHNTILINTAELATGLYFIQLKTEDGVQMEKFMVAK